MHTFKFIYQHQPNGEAGGYAVSEMTTKIPNMDPAELEKFREDTQSGVNQPWLCDFIRNRTGHTPIATRNEDAVTVMELPTQQ